jgi:hypothetical protein
MRLKLAFLTTSTFDYLRYRKYESKLAAYLITYIHAADTFNDFLDFQKVIDTKAHFEDQAVFWQSIEEFFRDLFIRLDKLLSSLTEMSKMLELELSKFPEFVNLEK